MIVFQFKIKKIMAVLLVTLILALPLVQTKIFAQPPYKGYVETEWSTDAAAPDAFLPEKVSYNGAKDENLEGIKRLKDPQDMFVKDELVYILDSGNSRIAIWNFDLEQVREIAQITDDEGSVFDFTGAEGIFVAPEGTIYIADTTHARVLVCDNDGKLLKVIEKPISDAFTTSFFKPRKVLVDANDSVYVIAEGVYQGGLVYDADGDFKTYFGSARIQPSLKVLADQVWKRLLSKDQRAKMSQYVPVEYTNFDIDPMGFIYTCSAYTTNNVEQIHKLNFLGNNIHIYEENFGEKDIVGYRTKTYITEFLDLTIRDDDVLFALDQTRGRVYSFDSEGNRLFVFGNLSSQFGGFATPVAIETIGEAVFVLDFTKGNVTKFMPTEYATRILKAVNLYGLGRYEESIKPWQEVLQMNSNNELAYTGMGQAMMRLGKYENARNFFRLGYDRANESRAYEKLREENMRSQAGFVMIGVVLLMTTALFLSSQKMTTRISDAISHRRKRSRGEKI